MGTVKYSALLTGIKGKVNGSLFQGSKAGATIRTKPNSNNLKPTATTYMAKTSTVTWFGCQALAEDAELNRIYPDGSKAFAPDQIISTAVLANVAKSWRNLSQDAQNAWNSGANNFPFKNRFGETYTASGFQVFTQLNSNMSLIGATNHVFPPGMGLPPIPPVIEDPGEDDPDDVFNFIFTTGIASGSNVLVFASRPCSLGLNSGKIQKKLIAIIPPCDPGASFKWIYSYQKMFGNPVTNSAIFFDFKTIDTLTGAMSQ